MRVPDSILKCVVFLGYFNAANELVIGGTGFLVQAPTSIDGVSITLLVTAKHNVRLNEKIMGVRVNMRDGTLNEIRIANDWVCDPDDEDCDIAVREWTPPRDVDCLVITKKMALDPERRELKGIGVGDEVYVVGLFAPVTKTKKNMPIVRCGHLAMIGSERIPINFGNRQRLAEVHLIEILSIGGLSGSPVFIQRSIEVQAAEDSGRTPLAAGALFLLGVLQGHWSFAADSIDSAKPQSHLATSNGLLNAGIAMVPPIERIWKMLEDPRLVKAIEAEEKSQRPKRYVEQPLTGGISLTTATEVSMGFLKREPRKDY